MTNGQSSPNTVSVVIPTLNAMGYLPSLIQALRNQVPHAPEEILIVDSGSTDGTTDYVGCAGEGIRWISISNFSHGGARNLGARESKGRFVVFLSQDAVPIDNYWLDNLLKPFDNPKVAATFARQTPNADANPMECYFLQTHFPQESMIYQPFEPGKDLVFRQDVFFSNVSSAARAEILRQFPFDESLIMSEDQQFARDVLLGGYRIVYTADAVVRHSHHYSWMQTLRRYVDSAYSLTQIFANHGLARSSRIGTAYLRHECRHMIRHHPGQIARYAAHVSAMTLGTILGHHAGRLPRRWVRRISLHSAYWSSLLFLFTQSSLTVAP